MKRMLMLAVMAMVMLASPAHGQETARILSDETDQWFFAQFSVDVGNWQSDTGGYCGEGGFVFDVPQEGAVLTITTYHNKTTDITKEVSTLESGDSTWYLSGYAKNGPRLSSMTAWLPGGNYDRGSVKVRFLMPSREPNIAVRLQVDSNRPLSNFQQIDPRYITSPTTGCSVPGGIFYNSPPQ